MPDPRIKRRLVIAYVIVLAVLSVVFRRIFFNGWMALLWGNLIASAYWAPIALIRLESVAQRHHNLQMAIQQRHLRIAADTHKQLTGIAHPLDPENGAT
jgi:hypothetical protein